MSRHKRSALAVTKALLLILQVRFSRRKTADLISKLANLFIHLRHRHISSIYYQTRRERLKSARHSDNSYQATTHIRPQLISN